MNGPETFNTRNSDQNSTAAGSELMSIFHDILFDEHQRRNPSGSGNGDPQSSHEPQPSLSVEDVYISQFFPSQPTSSSSTGDLASINNGSKRDFESRPHSSQFGQLSVGVPTPPGLSTTGYSPLPQPDESSILNQNLSQNLENILRLSQTSGNSFLVPDISSPSSSFHQPFQAGNNNGSGNNSSNNRHFMTPGATVVTGNVMTGDPKHHRFDLLSQIGSTSTLTPQQPRGGPTVLGPLLMHEQSNCSVSKLNFKQQQHPAAVQQQHSSVVPDIKSPLLRTNPQQQFQQQQQPTAGSNLAPYLPNPAEFAAIINNLSNSSPLGTPGSISSSNNGSLLRNPSSSSSFFDPFSPSAMANLDDHSPFGPRQPTSIGNMSELERFESQINSISNEVQATIQMYVNGLNSRKQHLIQQLEIVRERYSPIFHHQSRTESTGAIGPPSPAGHLSFPNISFTKPDVTLLKAISSIGFITVPAFAPFCNVSGDGLEVTIPGLNSSFVIHTKNCFQEELMVGHENVNVRISAVFDSNNSHIDHNQASSSHGLPPSSYSSAVTSGETPSISPSTMNEALSRSVTVTDHNNGKYTVLYSVPPSKSIPELIEIHVVINGMAVKGSPFKVKVMKQNKTCSWSKAMNYGTEGNAIGQLCRPWGVAIARLPPGLVQSCLSLGLSDDHSTSSHPLLGQPGGNQILYLVAVADRSNNRVQLFSLDMERKQMIAFQVFGSGPGTRDSQFDRPAGICINVQLRQIIVADKDNHRIQVFDLKGNFLFKFGEKGNRIGQFCYPWDVDSCPVTHEIAVSDTRNRRVQLFDSSGRYLSYFAQPLDSPRGVSFLAESKLLVSDFNKHRLLIFDRRNHGQHSKHSIHSSAPTTPTPPPGSVPSGSMSQSSTRFIGFGEGSGWGEFLRPQGTSVCGNFIFCSDSRNNRVCIYNLATQTFEYLFDDLNLDRPSGIAVLDNMMIVTDFGNNRLQIFQQH